jgi:rubrerythrin
MDNRAEIFALLKQHEVAISELYSAYAERFPYRKQFWLQLADEEMEHADVVDLLQAKIEENEAIYSQDKIRTGAIRSSIDYIERLTEEARVGLLRMVNALSIALDLEEAVIEKKFFQVVEGDTVDIKRMLQELQDKDQDHANRIHEELNKHRKD